MRANKEKQYYFSGIFQLRALVVSVSSLQFPYFRKNCLIPSQAKMVCTSYCIIEHTRTLDVLTFQTLVACQKDQEKQDRPRSDCFRRSSLIRAFLVCYPDKHFVNSVFSAGKEGAGPFFPGEKLTVTPDYIVF